MRNLGSGFWAVMLGLLPASMLAQTPAGPPATTIKVETKVVLVDAVVQDKKGNYVRDLTAQDFKVFEDDKEQAITSFSFQSDAAPAQKPQPRYMVLFFDDSTLNSSMQLQARQAAGKFIEASAGPDRLIALVDFNLGLRITQNFTSDVARLRQAVASVQGSAGNRAPMQIASSSPSVGFRSLETNYSATTLLLSIRAMAKNMASLPGRKSLVLLSDGFAVTAQNASEVQAVIAACTRANVAIYPVIARGLSSEGLFEPRSELREAPRPEAGRTSSSANTYAGSSFFKLASFSFAQSGGGQSGGGQSGGGGGSTGGGAGGGGGTTGGGGGTSGGGAGGGGGRGGGYGSGGGAGAGGTGTGGYPGSNYPDRNSPYGRGRFGTQFPQQEAAALKEGGLQTLADGTGGFVIRNTNDLEAGLGKVAKDQNEYYLLGYTPPDSAPASCHAVKVKILKSGLKIRARSYYCNVKPLDLLAQSATGKVLEARVTGDAPGTVAASMLAPYFYTAPNTARVNVAMEIPTKGIKFEKTKGKFRAAVNLLGIAYRPDGAVAARFSDTVNLEFERKKEMEAFLNREKPLHYETQFEAVPAKYKLKVAFSWGADSFGKLDSPLEIDPYDGKQFTLSGLALSNQVRKATDIDPEADAAVVEDRKPLVTKGMRVTPSGSSQFSRAGTTVVYAEIYAPALTTPNPPMVGVQFRLLDRKTGEAKVDSGPMTATNGLQQDSPVVPIGLKLPLDTLTPGAYRLELRAMDSVGHQSALRTADLDVQ